MNCLKVLRSVHHRPIFEMRWTRHISQQSMKYLDSQDRWKKNDGISPSWELIYKAPMDNSLNFTSAYLTVSTTTIACSALYYSIFLLDVNTINDPVILGDDVVIANNALECLVYLGAFIMFHVAIKRLLSKYVIRLYKKNDEYVAVFRGHWYNNIRKHKFNLIDFKKLNPTLVVTWGDARYSLGERHGILLDNYFKTPEHLNYLLYKRKPGSPCD